jgi:heme oxygenase
MPVLETLGRRTAPLHGRVERAVDLPARCGSVGAYRGLLARLLGIYRPIEHALSAFDWPAAGLGFDERRKTGLLSADLATLGLTTAQIEGVSDCAALPRPATLAAALGCLYVLEGATLGGQVIGRQVRRSLGIAPATGGSFHAAYGDRAGVMWRAFREAADAYCGDDFGRIEEAVAGAAATFEAFERWLVVGCGVEHGDPVTSP